MSEQTPRGRAATILAEHQYCSVHLCLCVCNEVVDTTMQRHQADMLAAAGLLADPEQREQIEDTLDELIARVEQDCNADAFEGALPEDPDWAEKITNLAMYADQCREVLPPMEVRP